MAAIFAAWAIVSLLTGETYDHRAGWVGEIVDRRKDPFGYWVLVVAASVAAGPALFAFVRDLHSN